MRAAVGNPLLRAVGAGQRFMIRDTRGLNRGDRAYFCAVNTVATPMVMGWTATSEKPHSPMMCVNS